MMATRTAKPLLKRSAARVRLKKNLEKREQLIRDGICIGCQDEPAMERSEFGASCGRKRASADAVAMKGIFLEFHRGHRA